MADISPEISAFQNAVYGEEVRGSMISLAEKLNDVTEDCESTVDTMEAGYDAAMQAAATATSNANSAAASCTSAASSASTAASSANTAAANATSKANAADALNTTVSTAEAARVAAENARVTAEQGRANAEAARVTAETARAGAEANRQSAELNRQEAETARNAAELGRVSAEATRAANETARQSAETSRVSAESNRVTEFTAMQRAFDDMSQQVLPPATYSTLGGVIIDQESGLEVDSDGVLSFTAGDFLTTTEAAATYATITTVNGKANAQHVHSAVDITSGTLAVARGGTGVTTAAAERERLGLGSTTGALPIANGGTGATTSSGALSAILDGSPLPVANGGTGLSTTASGAFYSTSSGGTPSYGTLPVAQGGTGATTLTSNGILKGDGTSAVSAISTASGALYATAADGAASFGTLPIAQGGTGSTSASDARTALGAVSKSGDTLSGSVYLQDDAIDRDGSNPSSDQQSVSYHITDKDGENLGKFGTARRTDGRIDSFLIAYNEVSGTQKSNSIFCSVEADGSANYTINDPSAFRNAIGASSGIFPLSVGGSGQSGTTSVTTTSSFITADSTNATISSGSVRKWGKVAAIYIEWKNKNAISVPANGNIANLTVGTLSSGYRPAGDTSAYSTGDNPGFAGYYIGSNGNIALCALEGTGEARTVAANTGFSFYIPLILA